MRKRICVSLMAMSYLVSLAAASTAAQAGTPRVARVYVAEAETLTVDAR
ncbi:MAG TPA: hypothetical protein VF508_08220 [Pyrinomonadaceae bacterium]|jgi:SpoU rRNA methylase family enzyme